MSANLDKTPFVKGEALQKLIEIIAGVKKGSDLRDDEIIKLFESDEQTEITLDEMVQLGQEGKLEPGHRYKFVWPSAGMSEYKYLGDDCTYIVTWNGKGIDSTAYRLEDHYTLIGATVDWFLSDRNTLKPLYISSDETNDGISRFTSIHFGIPETRTDWRLAIMNNKIGHARFVNETTNEFEFVPFITESDIDLSNYATKTYVTEEIAKIPASGPDDFIGTNNVTSVVDVPVTKSTVNARISADATVSFADGLPVGKEVYMFVENIGTSEITLTLPEGSNVESVQIGANETTEVSVINIDGTYRYRAAVDIEIPEIPGTPDLSDYATKDFVTDEIAKIEIPGAPDLSGYATETFVTNEIAKIQIPEAPDLSGYATKTYVAEEIAKIVIPEIPVDTFTGSNKVTTVVNVPVTKSTVLAEIATSETISFATGLPEGKEVYMVVKNTGTSTITLTLPANANVETIDVEASKIAEISVINIAGTYFVRAARNIEVSGGSCECPELAEITAQEVEDAFNNELNS